MPVQENFTEKMKVARNYVLIREVCGKSQNDVIKETGITKQNVNTWEQLKGNPGSGFIDQLSNYFGLPREVFYMDNLTAEYVKKVKNNASVQDPSDNSEKPLGEEAARIYKELYQKFLGDGSGYLVMDKDILKSHCLVPLAKLDEEKERALNDRRMLEQRTDEIRMLTEAIREISTRPINIQFPDVKPSKE